MNKNNISETSISVKLTLLKIGQDQEEKVSVLITHLKQNKKI